jgi:hypothetical protein
MAAMRMSARMMPRKMITPKLSRVFRYGSSVRKSDAAAMNVSIVKPSNTRSTKIVTSAAALLIPSRCPRMNARTTSPRRAGSKSFAI